MNLCCKDMSGWWRRVGNLTRYLDFRWGGTIYKRLYDEEEAIVHTYLAEQALASMIRDVDRQSGSLRKPQPVIGHCQAETEVSFNSPVSQANFEAEVEASAGHPHCGPSIGRQWT